MALSHDEKTLLEASYARVQFWRKGYGTGAKLAFFVVWANLSYSLWRTLRHSGSFDHSSLLTVAILGSILGVFIASAFYQNRLFKRDERLVRFFEERFPDECSWKQEEKVLAQAEDLRLKAKTDRLIHQPSSISPQDS